MNKAICKELRRLAADSVGPDSPERKLLGEVIRKGDVGVVTAINAKDSVRGRYQMLKRIYKRDPVARKKLDDIMAYVRVLRADPLTGKGYPFSIYRAMIAAAPNHRHSENERTQSESTPERSGE